MGKMQNYQGVGRALCCAGLLLTSTQARAALTLTLSEPGFATQTLVDTGNTGALSFFGAYGDFQTNFIAGLSNKLATPTPPTSTLQIQSINVKNMSTSGTTKTLTLTLSDDGYSFPSATGATDQLSSSFGGTLTGTTAGDTATFQSYVVSPATTTGLQSYTVPASTPGTTAFSSNVTPVSFTKPATYTLQNVTTISLTGSYEQANLSGTTSVAPVPEPTMIAGLVAMGLGLTARRRV